MAEDKNSSNLEADSNRIRRQVQSALRALSLDSYREESAQIIRLLAGWEPLQKAKIVAGFHPSRNEPQIQTLLQSVANTRTLVLPRVLPQGQMEFVHVADIHSELHSGSFGLMEPRLAARAYVGPNIELFFVPGIAFGKYGERIGHGGGYYDRFLAKFPQAIKVGLALSCQILNHEVPQLPHDIRMSYIVSPTGIIPTGA